MKKKFNINREEQEIFMDKVWDVIIINPLSFLIGRFINFQKEKEFSVKFQKLAIYNTEKSNGILHTKMYDTEMKKIQED